MAWVMILLLAVATPTEITRAEPGTVRMREALTERATELVRTQFTGREIRLELNARWIPRQLLRLDPSSLEQMELASPPDRVATFDVTARGRGGREHSFQLQYALVLEQRLPVANRRIEAGETILEEDLSMVWIDVVRPEHRWVSRLEQVAGKTTRTTHRAGQPFSESSLSGMRVVEAGDPVRMVYRQGSIEVVVNGEARESGAIGEAIGIYSQETRRRYRATIRDPETVIWEATQ